MKSLIKVSSFLAFSFLLFFACTSPDSNRSTEIISIDLEEMVNGEESVGLAEIAEEVTYVRLETLTEAMLNPTRLLYVNKNIFVLNRSGKVFLFTDEGEFVRQIGEIGAGPEEYLAAQHMEVSSDGSLIHLYHRKGKVGYTYNIDGSKVTSFPITYIAWRHAPLADGRHIMIAPYGDFSPDSPRFLFYLQDKLGNVIRKYPSTQVIKMMGDFSIGSFYIDPIRVLAFQPFCDTVFEVDSEGEMSPAFQFNFGTHRAPDELYEDMVNTMDPTEPYYLSPILNQTKDQLFIRIRELRKYHIGIYQFDDGNIFSIKTDNGMIPNDLDGGPDFWPAGTDGDRLLYRMLLPVNLLNPDKKTQKKPLAAENAEAAEAYQEMLKELNENDNPIVMIVKLR